MSKNEKRSFILYYDYRQHFNLLPDDQLGKLLRAVMDFEENGTEPDFHEFPALQMCFSFLRANLARDREEYERSCNAKRENGKKGGRPKNQPVFEETEKTKRLFSEPKKPDNDTDNEIDIEIDTDTEIDIEIDTDTENENETAAAPAHSSPSPSQKAYGEYQNVFLSDSDMTALQQEFPNDWRERIERVSEYVASSGRTYQNYLAVIRAWAKSDRQAAKNVGYDTGRRVIEAATPANESFSPEDFDLLINRFY